MDATSTTLRKSSNYDDTTAGAEASQKAPRILPPTPEPQVTSRDKNLLNKPTSVKLVRLAVLLVVVVAPFLFVIFLSKVLGGSNKAYLTSKVTQHFCCPYELQAVLRGINSTIDPCNDFYGHVCSRIDAGEVEHMSPLFRVIQQLNLMELAAPAQSSSAAGQMLAALRQGLWDAGRSLEDIADYVTAIVKAGNPAPRMNLLRMVRFLAELSLRYGLPSVVSFEISEAVRRGDAAYLPINLYASLQKRAKRVVALDVPVLGVDMAIHLWSFLLEQSWSAETSHSIETYKACFNGTDSGGYPNTAITALGVVSAIDAMMAIDWNVVSSVNDAEISVGRLVYLLWAYDKCASLPIMGTSVDVNLVLRNSPAFRPIFGCPQSAALAQRTCCLGTC
ncbi:hypothetical protein HPB49_011168 [Dermacentor silvarum]|uniref:Uncharacterized protein n=1 Tax=Dermacentor silvarum TaxID=543639 RepID=A0ACB8C354_DERSI|nr:hypothetical protein HPB49_011168 [Dermacentor silvarum]